MSSEEEKRIRESIPQSDLARSESPIVSDMVLLLTEIDRLRTALSEAEERFRVAVDELKGYVVHDAHCDYQRAIAAAWQGRSDVSHQCTCGLHEALAKLRQPGRDQ